MLISLMKSERTSETVSYLYVLLADKIQNEYFMVWLRKHNHNQNVGIDNKQ